MAQVTGNITGGGQGLLQSSLSVQSGSSTLSPTASTTVSPTFSEATVPEPPALTAFLATVIGVGVLRRRQLRTS
jgi:hypothetical protein